MQTGPVRLKCIRRLGMSAQCLLLMLQVMYIPTALKVESMLSPARVTLARLPMCEVQPVTGLLN